MGLMCVQIIQAHGGAVDPTFSSRCTHLLCESQVSGLFTQVRARLCWDQGGSEWCWDSRAWRGLSPTSEDRTLLLAHFHLPLACGHLCGPRLFCP